MTANRHALARYSRHCARTISAPWGSDEQFLRAVSSAVVRHRIDVLLPVTLRGVRATASRLADLQRLLRVVPVPGRAQLETVHDKWTFSQYLCAHQLPTPPTWNGDVLHPGASPLASEFFPALLKPTGEGGGYGITVVHSSDELRQLAARVAHSPNRHSAHILQGYVPGQDICLGALCRDGQMLAYTIQAAVGVSEGRCGPQRIMDFVDDPAVVALGARLFAELRWNGIAYVDLRRDARTGALVFIEFNPRIGQAVLGGLYAGVNLPVLACLLALGQPLPRWTYRPMRYAHPAAYMQILADRMRRRQAVDGIALRRSGCWSALADPLPELVCALQRLVRNLRAAWCKRVTVQESQEGSST